MKLKIPHTLILLFGIMIVAQISTYVLPQGLFDVQDHHGHQMVVPGTYHGLKDTTWLKPWHLLMAVPRAFADSQGIIFFIFIIGGALAIIKSTGAIDAMLGKMLNKFGNKPQILVFAGIFIFATGSSTLGMAEEYLPFVSVLITLCLALKLDVVAAIGILVVGYGTGYGVAAINPFTVVIAQEISGLRPTSGFMYRIFLFVPFFLVGWHHVQSYANKVYKDPTKSLMYGEKIHFSTENVDYPKLSRLHLFILILTLIAIALIVFGISELSGWGWYLTELGAVFLGLSIIVILVAKLNVNEAAKTFAEGASELTTTALLIGFARSIALILEDGQVLHTIIHGLSIPLQQVGPEISAVGMYAIQSIFNFFIPSGSGQAYVTMPIMAPIADLSGVSRQIAVLAYQFGDGFTNMIVPTNAVLMGILGIAGIPYPKWFKFVIGLMIKYWVLGSIALLIAVLIGYN